MNTFRSTYNAIQARDEAFKYMLESLDGLRREVFECILHFGPLTSEEIAEKLGRKVQSITGRVHELRGNLYDNDLHKTVFHEDKEYIEFDSYAKYKDEAKQIPMKKSGVRWRVTKKSMELQRSLF